MQESAQREIKTLQAALDLIEAYCRDGRRDRLGRVLLLHHAAVQAFGDYCKRRMTILTEPVYLAA